MLYAAMLQVWDPFSKHVIPYSRPWSSIFILTGPLYEEGERGPFRGLLVLVVIDTTPIIPFPGGL